MKKQKQKEKGRWEDRGTKNVGETKINGETERERGGGRATKID